MYPDIALAYEAKNIDNYNVRFYINGQYWSTYNVNSISVNGNIYGIVKEKDGYYVKHGLTESTVDYIGGMFMKNKNKFSSYSDAFKRLEYIKGQDEMQLQEATKYVLKQNKPQAATQQEAPAAAPTAVPITALLMADSCEVFAGVLPPICRMA